jgi:WD40 repeat protein/predicted Ser/Thr protein kinase
MSTPHSLPNAALLEKLLLGQLPPAEAEALCVQLQDSEQFAALAQSLIASDTLIEALHAQTTQPTPKPDARLEGLMARLSKLRPDLSGVADDRTAAEGPVAGGVPITFLSPARQPDEMGRLGEYRVLKVLGQGGMGVVFLAEDVRLGRRVALKTMRPEAAQMANAKQRFLREARGTAAIEHDHIIPIFQVGEENGVPFLAMPLLRGEPLDERLKRAGGKPLPVREIVRIGREIAEGLAAAHEQGLIHRDIKPANVWLEGERGRVKVLDFGLARAAGENTNLTQSGAIVGTPAYMAPEQARGEAIDPRCDLFSLGCLLYQMCTGQRPFNGPDTMSILMSLALDQPASPRQHNAELPAELSDLITRLLAKKPEDRPASARAVADALAAIERGLSDVTMVQTVMSTPAVARPKPARSRRRLAVAVAAALLLTSGLIAAVVIIRDKTGKEVARVTVPADGSVEVELDDKGKPPENDKKQATAIPADPLAKIEPGTPLGPMALVTNPAPLPGVRSWTIETRTPRGIRAVAYRPDGRVLATAGQDGMIRLLKPQTGELVRVLVGHTGEIAHLAWSPDGRTLASYAWHRTVRLWDADSGRYLRSLSGLAEYSAWGWSPDGRTIFATYRGRDILVEDVATGKTLHKITLSKELGVPAFSPDGKFLAGGSADNTVRIWEVQTGRDVRALEGHTGQVRKVAWSPDGRLLASTGPDGVRLWESDSGKSVWSHATKGNDSYELVWSPDGRTLGVGGGGWRNAIRLLRADNATGLRTLSIGAFAAIAWSPDGKHLADGGPFGKLGMTDVETGGRIELDQGYLWDSSLSGLAWSPDSKLLAAGMQSIGLRVVNPATGETTASLTDIGRPVAWSPSKWLAVAGPDTQLTLWQPGGDKHFLPGHKRGWVSALAWSPDGKVLADASRDDPALRLWDVAARQLKREWDAGERPEDLSWSPDGKLLAAGAGRQVKLWHTDTGKEMRTIPNFNGSAWSPVGETLAVYNGNGPNVRLFNVKTGELGLTLTSGGVQSVAWSPDGKLLAAACTGEAGQRGPLFLPVWDIATGEEVRKLDRVCLQGINNPLAWSPDGKRIASSAYQTIQLWDAATGKSEGVILPNPHFHGLTIRADGHYRGDAKVEDAIVMVVQKEDGGTETLPPAEFEQKYGWKNDPAKVRLIDK